MPVSFRSAIYPGGVGSERSSLSAYRADGPAPIEQGWLAAFVTIALVGQVSAVALPGRQSGAVFLASCAVLAVVVVLALVLPRLQVSSWVRLLAPLAYLLALALLFKSQESVTTGLQSLLLLPIAWAALYHRLRESMVLVAGVMCTVAVTSALDHPPVTVIIRRAGLWGMTGALVVLGAYYLRRWLGDAIAEREEALRQSEVLGEAARELNSTLDPAIVVATGVRVAAEIASLPGRRARRANYCRLTDGVVRVDAEYDAEGGYIGTSWPLEQHPLLAKAVTELAPTSGPLNPAELGPAVRDLAGKQGVAYGAWVPVVVGGELHGVLAVAGRNRPIRTRHLASCVAIVRIMELSLTNALAHERLQHAALTDPLTALANRRGLEQLVRERRGRRPLVILAIDVDGLKHVNDRHGHAAGDELLLSVGRSVRMILRTGDVLARIGGDEFAAVVFDSDEESGASVAARIVEAVNSQGPRGRAPRVSIGVATVEPGASLGRGLDRADAAMYEAKRAGGMRYMVADLGRLFDDEADVLA
jgi:diguanylate cyclase (GGDEF)-like protein